MQDNFTAMTLEEKLRFIQESNERNKKEETVKEENVNNENEDDLLSMDEVESLLNDLDEESYNNPEDTGADENDKLENDLNIDNEETIQYREVEEKNNVPDPRITSVDIEKLRQKPQNNKYIFDDDLMEGTDEVARENEEISKQLKEFFDHNKKASVIESAEKLENTIEDQGEPTDDISDIISRMDESEKDETNEEEKEDSSDILDLIDEYENRIFGVLPENDDEHVVGPADYVIEENEEYAESVEDILKNNNIVIVKKSEKEKSAILDRFSNSGNKVSLTLVNSGIFVTLSGAGTGEVIAMNQMNKEDPIYVEMDKLGHVCNHIVGSSIGKMKLSQLVKIVSFYDIDQLYYGLYAATYPDTAEVSITCNHCNKEYYVNLKTNDMLLNHEHFKKQADDIRNNVTTYNRLLETSKLGTIYKKAHGNDLIVYYRHPSIENYLNIKKKLRPDILEKYISFYGEEVIYSIAKVAVRVENNSFIEITDPNVILEKILGQIKDSDIKYEINAMAKSLIPDEIPTFGIRKHYCPHCGGETAQIESTMDSMLFFIARQREQISALKWAAIQAKEKKMKKKSDGSEQ